MEIEYELEEKDLAALTLFLVREREDIQRLFYRYEYLVPGALAVTALLFFIYLGKVIGGIAIMLAAVAWYLIAPRWLQARLRKQALAHFSEEEKKALTGHYLLRAEADALVVKHGGEEFRIPWEDILRVDEDDRYAFIFTDLKRAYPIPKRRVKKKVLQTFLKRVERRIAEASV